MYCQLHTRLWNDRKIKKLSFEDKSFFVYLISNPQSHSCGLYFLPPPTISYDTGLSLTRISKKMKILCDAGLIEVDSEIDLVWIRNKMRYPENKSPRYLTSVASHLASLHRSPLIYHFLQYYSQLNIPYEYPTDTPPIGLHENVVLQNNINIKKNLYRGIPKSDTPPQKETFKKTVELTDKEEQLEAINAKLPELSIKFATLDVPWHFEQWQDRLVAKALFSVDYEADFRIYLRNAEKWAKERDGPPGNGQPTPPPRVVIDKKAMAKELAQKRQDYREGR